MLPKHAHINHVLTPVQVLYVYVAPIDEHNFNINAQCLYILIEITTVAHRARHVFAL